MFVNRKINEPDSLKHDFRKQSTDLPWIRIHLCLFCLVNGFYSMTPQSEVEESAMSGCVYIFSGIVNGLGIFDA